VDSSAVITIDSARYVTIRFDLLHFVGLCVLVLVCAMTYTNNLCYLFTWHVSNILPGMKWWSL